MFPVAFAALIWKSKVPNLYADKLPNSLTVNFYGEYEFLPFGQLVSFMDILDELGFPTNIRPKMSFW